MLPHTLVLESITIEAKDEVGAIDATCAHRGLDIAKKLLEILKVHQMPRLFSRTEVIGSCQAITNQISL